MIDRYITNQVRKRSVTLYDIIGGEYIDPDPGDRTLTSGQRARRNRFYSLSGELRFCELITEREFDPDRPYKSLAIPAKDLVRYWWNNVADQEGMMREILEDIFTLYKDRMLPEEKEENIDLDDALDRVFEHLFFLVDNLANKT